MMDIPMLDSYLETLDGYIRDDDKLVTYKWLSKELEVHVNIAKIILWRYLQKYKNDKLVATFLLIGNLKSQGMRVEVVKDINVEKAKEKFEKIISEHVYSVQKELPDIELLAGTGKGDSRFSAIRCEESSLLSDEDLLKMRWGKASFPQTAAVVEKKEPKTLAQKTEHRIAHKTKKQNLSSENIEQTLSKNDTRAVKETTKSTNDGTNATESKSQEQSSKKVSPPIKPKAGEKKSTASKKPVQSTKVGFGNLFGKVPVQQKVQVASSTSEAPGESIQKKSDNLPETKSPKPAVDSSFEKIKDKENQQSLNATKKESISSPSENEVSSKSTSSTKIDKPSMSKKSKVKKSKNIARGTKRNRSDDSSDEKKKRKRIFVASDSSEDSAAPSEDEDMFSSPPPKSPSPPKNKSPTPPTIECHGNKRKVRKLVDKTFIDEDNFLITKKVHVYESCSDEEPEVAEMKKKIEPEVAKATKKVDPKETKANVKKKQTSLMNFFKKA